MKRLLKISFDMLLSSVIPIFLWVILSVIVDKNLINVFTLIYPVQFIYGILKSIFATGANISKERDKNNYAVLSGMTIGIIIGLVFFGYLILNVESYISFMNLDVSIYKEFAIYAIIQIYLQLILSFILNKLYYEGNNTLANKYSITFNLLNFIVLVLMALIFKEKIYIVGITVFVMLIYTIIISIKSYNNFKFKLNIFNCLKYDSVQLFNQFSFFIIYLFGFSNSFQYGEIYAVAISFTMLITDSQWDVFDSIVTVATIDISKKKFNYKEHRKNAYILMFLLLLSTFVMFGLLYKNYNLNLIIILIILSFNIINFIVYPIYRIKTCYLQLEYSPLKVTTNKIVSNIGRTLLSFTTTPYCTGFGMLFSTIYQFITVNIMFGKNFIVDKKTGYILPK